MTSPENTPHDPADQHAPPQYGGQPYPAPEQQPYPQQPYGAAPGQQPYGAGPGQPPYGAAPGQAPYGAMPPQQPGIPATHGVAAPQPTAKTRKKWPWILGALAVLIVIIAVATSGGGDSDSNDTAGSGSSSGAGNDSKAAAMNTPVRDGKFEFTVTGVESGVTDVGDNPFLNQQAQGQYTIVTVTVKNIGDKPQSFFATNQKLKDTAGRTFETDPAAQLAVDSDDVTSSWQDINPGNSVNAKLVFDMPADATPAEVILHDSMFSGGATVSLS